jgi:hypothetical protein
LMVALICLRSPYIQAVEKETAVYQGANEDFTAHLLSRPDLRELFRSEIKKVIQDARGEL